jgi:diphosphomevalonate decarboxylase
MQNATVSFSGSALAHPNIAFIKYWGDTDPMRHLPSNGSISMNLGNLYALTRVNFIPGLTADLLTLNGNTIQGPGLKRVSSLLDRVRKIAHKEIKAEVVSNNNFPTSAGIASSAAAFAALSLAATTALGVNLSESELSRLARRGSGSACRSIPAGFVEWQVGNNECDSFATSIAPPEHWKLVDCIAVVQTGKKAIGSKEGHTIAATSPLQAARVAGATQRLDKCRRAILERDFTALAEISELDCLMMHAVMDDFSPFSFLLGTCFYKNHEACSGMAKRRIASLFYDRCWGQYSRDLFE